MIFHKFKSAVIGAKVFDVLFIWFRLVRVRESKGVGEGVSIERWVRRQRVNVSTKRGGDMVK
jgi:hypothetical protein